MLLRLNDNFLYYQMLKDLAKNMGTEFLWLWNKMLVDESFIYPLTTRELKNAV